MQIIPIVNGYLIYQSMKSIKVFVAIHIIAVLQSFYIMQEFQPEPFIILRNCRKSHGNRGSLSRMRSLLRLPPSNIQTRRMRMAQRFASEIGSERKLETQEQGTALPAMLAQTREAEGMASSKALAEPIGANLHWIEQQAGQNHSQSLDIDGMLSFSNTKINPDLGLFQ